MAMFLKNYTSNVPVSETLHNIEKVLIKCGVSGITKEYGNNSEVIAVTFHIQTDPQLPRITVRLPADKERCLQALWEDYVDGDKLSPDGNYVSAYGSRKKKRKQEFAEQAARTAWKIIQDWVEVQMSMIQTKQAEFTEVFLPYIYDDRSKTTVFARVKSTGMRALLPETTTP